MSHEIQSAVFSALEGAGWTGLGIEIPLEIATDGRKIAELCGANYRVEKRQCYYHGEKGKLIKAPNREVLVRADTHEMLSIASTNRYNLDHRQPVDLFVATENDLRANKMSISHACVLRNGAEIAISCLLPPEFDVNLARNDLVRRYLTVCTGYNGKPTRVMIGDIRVVCANTLAWATQDAIKSGRTRAIRASTPLEADSIQQMMDSVREHASQKKEVLEELARAKMSDADVLRYFADVLEIDVADLGKMQGTKKVVSTKSENILKAFSLAYANSPGADMANGTAWGALNAVTYYATHLKTVRDTRGDGENAARVGANLNGDAARLKMRAMALAQQYVGIAA